MKDAGAFGSVAVSRAAQGFDGVMGFDAGRGAPLAERPGLGRLSRVFQSFTLPAWSHEASVVPSGDQARALTWALCRLPFRQQFQSRTRQGWGGSTAFGFGYKFISDMFMSSPHMNGAESAGRVTISSPGRRR